jgi:hypothetical protein
VTEYAFDLMNCWYFSEKTRSQLRGVEKSIFTAVLLAGDAKWSVAFFVSAKLKTHLTVSMHTSQPRQRQQKEEEEKEQKKAKLQSACCVLS